MCRVVRGIARGRDRDVVVLIVIAGRRAHCQYLGPTLSKKTSITGVDAYTEHDHTDHETLHFCKCALGNEIARPGHCHRRLRFATSFPVGRIMVVSACEVWRLRILGQPTGPPADTGLRLWMINPVAEGRGVSYCTTCASKVHFSRLTTLHSRTVVTGQARVIRRNPRRRFGAPKRGPCSTTVRAGWDRGWGEMPYPPLLDVTSAICVGRASTSACLPRRMGQAVASCASIPFPSNSPRYRYGSPSRHERIGRNARILSVRA